MLGGVVLRFRETFVENSLIDVNMLREWFMIGAGMYVASVAMFFGR